MITAKELRAIAKVMDECGVAFIKTADLEMHRDGNKVPRETALDKSKIVVPPETPVPPEDPIIHKTVELTSVMKLSDMELLDNLFPDHTQEEAS